MNIFILDTDIVKCAQYHTDKHVVKMITETAQLLCSAYYYQDKFKDEIPYTLTHANHPCAKWVRHSIKNWEWLLMLGVYLYKEYMHRFGNKTHKAGNVILWCYEHRPNLSDNGLTMFEQCMPEQYKDSNPVTAYRNYYNGEKKELFKWTGRTIPYWIRW